MYFTQKRKIKHKTQLYTTLNTNMDCKKHITHTLFLYSFTGESNTATHAKHTKQGNTRCVRFCVTGNTRNTQN